MRIKLKKNLIILLLATFGFSLYSCIEEPTNEAIKRPFTEVRLVNLSNNVDGMRIIMDGQQVATLPITGTTGYFDVKSGDRTFLIRDANNDSIYGKVIPATSYDRATLIFTGFDSRDILLNTFSNFEVGEGWVYVNSAPAAGRLNIYVVHSSSSVDTTESKVYTVRATVVPTGGVQVDTTYRNGTDSTVAFGESHSIGNALPGDYTFRFVSADGTVNTQTYTLSAGMRYYLFIYDHPNNVQFFLNEVVPRPIRNK